MGIGYLVHGSVKIYHVTNDRIFPSALQVDYLKTFIESPDVYYLSIWKMNTTLQIFKKVISICKNFEAKKIYFDASFQIQNDDSLYCSEFCAVVIKKSD